MGDLTLWRANAPALLFLTRQRKLAGKNLPSAGVWDFVIEPGSLCVRNASVPQAWMSVVSDFFSASIVVLKAVCQLDANFARGCMRFVGVASVEKSSHGFFLILALSAFFS